MLCCQVPIEVMNSMTRVPAPYLKQLAEEREIFNELPATVKQQVRIQHMTTQQHSQLSSNLLKPWGITDGCSSHCGANASKGLCSG